MNLTETPYLILFVLLAAAGIGTASALATITLVGDVTVDGDLTVNGDVDTSGEYEYSSAKTRSVFIAAAELIPDSNTLLQVSSNGENALIASGSTDREVFASIPNLPDGATITELECRQVDSSAAITAICTLYRANFNGIEDTIASVATTGSSGVQTGTDDIISFELVDRDTHSYYLEWSVSNTNCGIQCGFISAKITFTVPQAD